MANQTQARIAKTEVQDEGVEKTREEIIAELVEVGRKHSTSVVLFHAAIAESMGLNPTDHKCLDLLLQRGSMPAGRLAELTGLTTGTMTAVLDRLEAAKFVRRVADPTDRRKVLIEPLTERLSGAAKLFGDFLRAIARLQERYSDKQLATILDYLTATSQVYDEEAQRLRRRVKQGKRASSK